MGIRKSTVKVFVCALVSLLFASTSHAATLYTAPIPFNWIFGYSLECVVTNARPVPTLVRVRALDDNGDTAQDSADIELAPYASFALTSWTHPGYCRFDVRGNRKSIRAGAAMMTGNTTRAWLPAE